MASVFLFKRLFVQFIWIFVISSGEAIQLGSQMIRMFVELQKTRRISVEKHALFACFVKQTNGMVKKK